MPTTLTSRRTWRTSLRDGYRWWRARQQPQTGKLSHIRRVDLLATYAARIAAPWFQDILWNARRHTPTHLSPTTQSGSEADLPSRSTQAPAAPERRLYLTFDDGPHPQGTGRILNILARHGVPATFFLLGQQVERTPQLARDIAAAGHSIGNHTYSHLDAWMHPFQAVSQELHRTDALLADLLGSPVRWMRPPHGHFTAKIRDWCRVHGQRLVMWDLLPADFVAWRSAAEIVRSVERQARPGSIVVLHDSDSALRVTPTALEELLPRLLDRGWQFASL